MCSVTLREGKHPSASNIQSGDACHERDSIVEGCLNRHQLQCLEDHYLLPHHFIQNDMKEIGDGRWALDFRVGILSSSVMASRGS